jgi:hypothetical protein
MDDRPIILIIRTARRRYAVRRDDVIDIRLVPDAANMPLDERGRPFIGVELGPLIDRDDRSSLRRRRALVVPMRRRKVALLADLVESFHEQIQPVRLPDLLGARLSLPWVVGALLLDDDVILQLDLRAVARSVLAQDGNS